MKKVSCCWNQWQCCKSGFWSTLAQRVYEQIQVLDVVELLMEEVEELYPCAPTTDTAMLDLMLRLSHNHHQQNCSKDDMQRKSTHLAQLEISRQIETSIGSMLPQIMVRLIPSSSETWWPMKCQTWRSSVLSAAVERTFSHGGSIMRRHRSSLWFSTQQFNHAEM